MKWRKALEAQTSIRSKGHKDMSFLSTLKPMELSMLRGIVRKTEFAYVEAKHGKAFVTDYEVDKLIDSIGPEIIERMIKFGVDKGLR